MNRPHRFLALFLPLLAVGCAQISRPSFNILDFGAHPDASATSTDAIRSAILAAKAAGGGTVLIPPGNYLTGPIELTSNLVLDIQAGATLRFHAARLPFTQGRVQGIECLTPVPLIDASNAQNVTITGRGLLTTDNAEWLALTSRPQPKSGSAAGSAFGPEWNHLLALLQQHTPQPRSEYLKVAPYLRPDFLRTMDSNNILIQGIHIVGSPFWTVHLLYSRNIDVRDVSFETYPGIFTGGIYVDSSSDVRISNCYLDNGDDAITLKAGKDADGLRVNRPTENVAISNCIIHRGSGAIVIGSETSGGIRDVVVSNILCDHTQLGIHIKSERGRGGSVENIRIDNMVMDYVGRPISISEFYSMQGETAAARQPVTARTPVFRDISISHITIRHSPSAPDYSWNPISVGPSVPEPPVTIEIAGLPEMPISDLRLSDITAFCRAGLKAANTIGLELHDIRVNPDAGPAFYVHDSTSLELDDVSTTRPSDDAPVIRLEHCPGAVLRDCQAYPGTTTFLSVPPGELSSITLQGNALSNVRTPTTQESR